MRCPAGATRGKREVQVSMAQLWSPGSSRRGRRAQGVRGIRQGAAGPAHAQTSRYLYVTRKGLNIGSHSATQRPARGMLLPGQQIHAQSEDRQGSGVRWTASWQSKLVRNYSLIIGPYSTGFQAEGVAQQEESHSGLLAPREAPPAHQHRGHMLLAAGSCSACRQCQNKCIEKDR